jgi:RNA polymerase sigma-70 factor (ECF subfamily)
MGADRAERDARWARLMALSQAGGRAPYAELLRETAPFIRTVVGRRLRGSATAEDVVQDVLLTLHRVRHTYDPRRPFTPWLVAIAERRCIDAMRRRSRVMGHETSDDRAYETFADTSSSRDLEAGQAAEEVGVLLSVLPRGQREAVELLKIRELSLAEAAAVSGQSIGALKVAVHRAIRSLKLALERLP